MRALPLVVAVVLVAAIFAGRRQRGASRAAFIVVYPTVATLAAALAYVYVFPALVGVGPPPFPMALGSAAMIAALPALAPGRARPYVAALALIVGALLTLADVVYWRFFGGLMPLLAANSASHIGDVWDSISSLFRREDTALLPLVLVAPLLPLLTPRDVDERGRPGAPLRLALIVATVLGGVVPVAVDVGFWLQHRFSWKVQKWAMPLSQVGLIGAHARDIARTTRELLMREPPDEETLRKLEAFAASRDRPGDPTLWGVARGMDVVLVQVEAMQEFVVDAKLHGEPVMPFLSTLARDEALTFTNLWDQTGASPTSDCEYLVLNSQHPLSQGAVAFRRPGNAFVALPHVLGAHGYASLSAHAYEKGMWNRAIVHPAWGFTSSAFKDELGAGPRVGWGLSDKVFLPRAVEHLARLEEPTLGFFITLTSHHPYGYVRGRDRELDVKVLGKDPLGGYLQSMRFVDGALRALFGALEKRGQKERTMVVIYGDHDSKLTFSPAIAAAAARVLDVDLGTLEALGRRDWRTKKIPLVIVVPGLAPRVIHTAGGQIDIAPTVLHLLGVEKPRAFFGRALTGGEGQVARFDGAAADGEVVWDVAPSPPVCLTVEGAPALPERCAELRETASVETAYSELVTLEDLAARLARTSSPPPSSSPGAAPTGGDPPAAPPPDGGAVAP